MLYYVKLFYVFQVLIYFSCFVVKALCKLCFIKVLQNKVYYLYYSFSLLICYFSSFILVESSEQMSHLVELYETNCDLWILYK